ncbi:ExbD/TolR family protein [Aurantibacillus circumpalustris]|uniref:ExbD/TolR family protein n=1 Tax=Aurantibacillus circumpalustris TaxID=3036359 RepID=UPI00295AEDF0|nr:biopolymer transporter ExbD [Aurantibacillus circumpalustris]
MALRKKHRESEVSTDALNDIMFFLLLFFIILSTMVSPNSIKVNLPKSDPNVTVENNRDPIHVAITKDKKYYVNSAEIQKENLEAAISKLAATKTEPMVLMHLDKDLTIQEEIDIMTICYRLKCKTVLATAATKK